MKPRADLLGARIDQASTLSLYTSNSYAEALNLGISDLEDILGSKAMTTLAENHKGRRAELEAVLKHINAVIKSVNNLGRGIANLQRR
ncbi:MAG: hypothetical protein RLZZ373_3202 [Pseudomonadota bacterium]